MKLPFTKSRTSANIQNEIDATTSRVEALTSECIAAERRLDEQAGDMDRGDVATADRDLDAMTRQRKSLMLKVDALVAERDELAARETEQVKAERAKTERKAHADAIRRLPSAAAAVQSAHAALNAALGELYRLDPYAGAMGAMLARPAISPPTGFSSGALSWDAVVEEATRARQARMNGETLNLSVWHDDCWKNTAAARAWGDLS